MPAIAPYAPAAEAPMLNAWTASPKSTSTLRSGAGSVPGASPRPGASTKKSSRSGASRGGATSR